MRPVLLGMNNPVSPLPQHALYPFPPGCTGWRLLRMLNRRLPDVTRAQYLAAFDRRNLMSSLTWDKEVARAAAGEWLRAEFEGRLRGLTVLVLGQEVRKLLDLEEELIHPIERNGVTYRQLPHPSGRNHWYNDERNLELASLLLEELYERGREHADG